jgi:tetratricopeptide (TPR) repeat protein
MYQLSPMCPQCSSELICDYVTNSAICACGYSTNTPLSKVYEKRSRNLKKVYGVGVLVVMGLYMHIMSWGSYATQIPGLKLSTLVGTASPKTYQTIVDACVQQNKWVCVQDTYLAWYKATGDVETISKLAHFRVLLKDYVNAAKAYESYYRIGGKDPAVAIQYGLVLEKNNDLENALKYFGIAIQTSDPGKLPAQATGEIVTILIKQQKLEQARQTIMSFWDSAENAKGYFNAEFDALNKALGPASKTSKVAKR